MNKFLKIYSIISAILYALILLTALGGGIIFGLHDFVPKWLSLIFVFVILNGIVVAIIWLIKLFKTLF